ncbi:MAG: response regulator [Desulfobacterales bacterium]|nr:response regulator [Desulfobacterales bacterium]
MNHILVIDDDEHISKILSLLLSDLDYQVEAAHNGKAGIKLFNTTFKFDLVITDIRMPDMDGYAVAKHIRGSAKSDTPIVGITGYADEVDRQWFDVMLIKPISLEAVMRVVESFT